MEIIELQSGGASARIAPGRGGIVTGYRTGEREILYLDEATLEGGGSVRGGIPILFPFCGRLPDDRLAFSGTTMKQHGFARNEAWRAVERHDDFLRERLEAEREDFPRPLALEQTVHVSPERLRLELITENLGDRPFPISPGWHPYFPCAVPDKERIVGHAPAFPAGTIRDSGVDEGVEAPADGRTRVSVPGLGELRIDFSSEMKFFQLWTLPGKPFVCLEPFHGSPNTINGERALIVEPGERRLLWMEISVA